MRQSTSSLDSQRGRAVPIVLALVALVGVGVLFFGEDLGLFGGSGDDDTSTSGLDGDMLGYEDGEGEGAETDGASTDLAPLYGDGDRGAIRLRLLWAASGEPVRGQIINLINKKGANQEPVTTDTLGVAEFRKIWPSRGYSLLIKGEGFKAVSIRGIVVKTRRSTDLQDIYLGENHVIRGRVVDRGGQALPAANVTAFQGTPKLELGGVMFMMADMALSVPNPLEAADTDGEGYFTLSALDDGVYRLEARHGGYETGARRNYVVQTDRTARMLTLVLNEGAQLSGVVKNDAGEAIAGARVVASLDEGRWFSASTPQREITYTDENGKYVLDTLGKELRYRFGVIADDYSPMFDTRARQVEEDDKRDFILTQGGTLRGVITNKETGEPVEDAQIVVSVGSFMSREENATISTATARSGKDGSFELVGVKAGQISSAQIRAPGFVTESRSQWGGNQWPAIAVGEVTEVTAEMQRGGIVRGIVRDDANNEPIAGATVLLDSRMSFWAGTSGATSDENGEYQLVGVRAGEYGVVASAAGYAPSDPTADRVTMDEAGGTQTVDLTISAAGMVAGTIKDAEGEPVVGVRVRVAQRAEPQEGGNNAGRGRGRGRGRGPSMTMRMLENSRAVVAMTDTKGTYKLEGVGSGRWVVVAEGDEGGMVRTESEPFKLSAGESEEIDITMVAGGVLSGRVVDERGQAVSGARVRVGQIDPGQARQVYLSAWRADRALDPKIYTTDGEGRFTVEGLAPGTTLVKVEAKDYVTFYKRNLRVQAGGNYDNYTVRLDKGEVVEGIVRGTDGKIVTGAYVALTQRDEPTMDGGGTVPEGEEAPDVEPSRGMQSDKDGRFRIVNVPRGTYSAVIWFARGYKSYRSDQNAAAIKRGILAPTSDVEFRLEPEEPGATPRRGG